jgi:DNA repair exonuclease SbcCD ATPase subunit
MPEQAAQAVEQAELIALLFKILQFVIVGLLGLITWWAKNEFRKSEEKEKSSAKERLDRAEKLVEYKEEQANKLVEYKEEQAKIIAALKSDLRSNTESDTTISKTLEEFKVWFADLKKIMDKLVVDVEILINKK